MEPTDVLDCTRLVEWLKTCDDPRARRGVRHRWWVVLTIMTAAHVAGVSNFRAIAQWARDHERLLARRLPLFQGRVPSEKTFQRALQRVDLGSLGAVAEGFLGELGADQPVEDVALDGKTVCGASSHGRQVHLLSLVGHTSGRVFTQRNVHEKTNEIPVARALLAGRPLHGAVVTGDALHCQLETSQQVLDQGGHYLWAVKDNQPTLADDLALFFSTADRGPHRPLLWTAATLEKNRGRIEQRFLAASAAMNDYLSWPGLQQVVSRVCQRTVRGQTSLETHYYITSLSHQEASPERLLELCRGHWTIENRLHYRLDVTFGEDASTIRTGSAAEGMALLRRMALAVIDARGWRLASDAQRHYRSHPAELFSIIGARRL